MAFYFGSFLWDLLALLATAAAVVYGYFWWKFQYWKRRNIPYFEPTIPWGNLESPVKRSIYVGDNLLDLYNKEKAKGWKYFGMYFVNQPNIIVTDLELLKMIMTKDFNNFVDRGMYINEKDDPMGCTLFAIGGVKWKNLRVKLSPTFTSGKLKSMFNTLVDCGVVLEKYIQSNIKDGEGVDVKEILGKFSTDIIGSCAFGLECNSFKDPNSPFRKHGKRAIELTPWDNFKFAFSMSFPNFSRAVGIVTTPKETAHFMRNIVEETVTYRLKNNVTRNDFLQLLIEILDTKASREDGYTGDGKTLTMDEVAAQCLVFFLGGFETSSTTMTFALYLLAQNQDIQDRAREEIKTVLGRHEGKMTYDSLSELKYMKQIIDETLRLFPPLPFLTRQALEDYPIPNEDVILEKGTTIFIPVRGLHLDEEYFENPTEFDPERFNEENKAKIPHYAFIPFGEGPRICIGERFGIMQTKVGLTSILRNYKVTLNSKTKLPLKLETEGIIPAAEGGIWLNLEKI